MRDSKQIVNILFLCLLSARFRATADRRIPTIFPTCVIDNFCVWLKRTQSDSLLGASNCGKWLLASPCLSVRLYTRNSSTPTGRNVMTLGIWISFELPSGKFKFSVIVTRNAALWHDDRRVLFVHFHSTFIVRGNISEKSRRENKTHILLQKEFLQKIVAVNR